MSKTNFIIYTLCAVFFIIVVSCNKINKTTAKPIPEEIIQEDIVELRADQIKLANIHTGEISLRSISGTLKVSGVVSVAPQSTATVCMPMGGFVKNISIMPGSQVHKGQTLAILENQEFIDIQQNYLESKNKLEYAEAEYKRHNELYKDDVYSQKNVQQVTSEYKNLKAMVKALEQKLGLIGINASHLHEDDITSSVALVSPISGYIKKVNINIGKYVSPSDILVEIVNKDKLFLDLTLFEKDAEKVAEGQKIKFFINNETDQHDAIITQTSKAINADKTYNVYATVSGFCKNILPGMYVNALINAESNKVTTLPSEAVVGFEDKDYIFIFDKDKTEDGKPFTEYRMIQIKKGISEGGYTEIILPKGFDIKTSKVVIDGAYNLLSAKKNAGEMSCGL